MDAVPIDALEVSAYRVPTDAPEADGTLEWDATEMVVVHLSAGGQTAVGYSYTAGLAAATLIRDKLRPLVMGADALHIPVLWQRMNRALRNIGRPGLGLMAVSAVDHALWDLKAKLLGVPLATLLGAARSSVPLYGSGGFTTYSDERLQQQLEEWRELGFPAVKIKIGTGIDEDIRRVALARKVIGGQIRLMVDVNGAYDRRTALALIDRLQMYDICWLEEPVSSDDLPGLRWLRDRAPAGLAITAGEYGWDADYFQKMLAAGAVDVLQADASRCAPSGFLQTGVLCEAQQIPLSAHCAPALHVPLCAAVPRFQHLEYFHDHVRIEGELFEGGPILKDGAYWPNLEQPGHGLQFRRQDAERYRL